MRRRLSAGTAAVGLLAGLGAVAAPALAAAAEPVTLLSEDFEDGDLAPLDAERRRRRCRSSTPTATRRCCVAGRANDFDGVKTPAACCSPAAQYTFSMQVKLAAGHAGDVGARFVVEPAYTWVGNTAVSADAWTTVTGTFTAPADGSAATLRAYIGTARPRAAPYDYLVDDLVITGTAGDGRRHLDADARPVVRAGRRGRPDRHPARRGARHRQRRGADLRRRPEPRRDRHAAGLPEEQGHLGDVLRHRPEHHGARAAPSCCGGSSPRATRCATTAPRTPTWAPSRRRRSRPTSRPT